MAFLCNYVLGFVTHTLTQKKKLHYAPASCSLVRHDMLARLAFVKVIAKKYLLMCTQLSNLHVTVCSQRWKFDACVYL